MREREPFGNAMNEFRLLKPMPFRREAAPLGAIPAYLRQTSSAFHSGMLSLLEAT